MLSQEFTTTALLQHRNEHDKSSGGHGLEICGFLHMDGNTIQRKNYKPSIEI
jgi:hypothetical protein